MSKKEVLVYWTSMDKFPYEAMNMDLAYLDLHQRVKNMSEFSDKGNSTHILKCPVAMQYLRNTFRLKSPLDYDFTWNLSEKKFSSDSRDQDFFDENVLIRDMNEGLFSLKLAAHIFFTEEPSLKMVTKNPIYARNEIKYNCSLLEGELDIAKWFRNIDLVYFVNKPDVKIKINRGDTLAYLKFSSNEKIKLVRFYYSNELRTLYEHIVNGKIRLATVNNNIPFIDKIQFIYDTFLQSKYKEKIIKEIKSNLME